MALFETDGLESLFETIGPFAGSTGGLPFGEDLFGGLCPLGRSIKGSSPPFPDWFLSSKMNSFGGVDNCFSRRISTGDLGFSCCGLDKTLSFLIGGDCFLMVLLSPSLCG